MTLGKNILTIIGCVGVCMAWTTAAEKDEHAALTAEQTTFFESKVRPVLAQSCYKCHSTEAGKTKGGLALDSRSGWQKGGNMGPAIVPGDPEKSILIKAIKYEDADLQMPPKGEKLSSNDIATLVKWVEMGAPDPRLTAGGAKLSGMTDKARAHWAYQPVQRTLEPPVVKNKAGVATYVDAFILAKLEAAEITPNRPANRETLLRRATYDLTGLPPTPEEVRAFQMDRSPNAWAKVIDRLLASPAYGERWGRYWLDTARYADTTGSDSRFDDYRYVYAWTYRDYVVKAFNDDMPYDQFLKEQIAADLLPDAAQHPESMAALGFITVGKRFVNPNDTIDERIDTVSKATMAITVACARCHDHKFDPIPTADYYSLHGLFASITEPKDRPLLGSAPVGSQAADYAKKRGMIEDRNRDIYFKHVDERLADFRKKAGPYILTSLYSFGKYRDPAKKRALVGEFDLDSTANGTRLNAVKSLRPNDPVFAPMMWFAALPEGSFQAGASEVLARISHGGDGRVKLNPMVVAAFRETSASSLHNLRDVANVYGKLFASIDSKARSFVAAKKMARSGDVTGYDPALAELIQVPLAVEPASGVTTEYLKANITKLLLGEGAYNHFVFAALNDLDLTHPGAPAKAMVVNDLPTPKDSPVFIRGDAQQKGKIVPRQFLEVLSGANRQPFKQGSGRLELAEAIASKHNPLTARVAINRIWMHHFGEGIVRTPDDIGVQSEPPSHPELLDYMTTQFVENGWSMKKIHRAIMLSNTYQQSSDTNPKYTEKDPENRLLWRANLRRLDFEAIRDSLLQFTGKMDKTIGGRPVNLTDEPYSYRRSIYGFVDRGSLPEIMAQFDYGDPNRPNSKRTSTIVPQQALFFMNSPMSVDVARKVCSRPEFTKATNDYGRVKAIYEVIYQREPKGTEMRLAAEFYNKLSGNGTPLLASALKPAPGAKPGAPKPKAGTGMGGMADPNKMMGGSDKRGLQNEGQTVERRGLTIWEQYAQALLFTNEIVYVH